MRAGRMTKRHPWSISVATLIATALVTSSCGSSDAPPADVGPSPADQARSAIENYYAALNADQFRKAWSMLGSGPREEYEGFQKWKSGFETILKQEVKTIEVLSSNDSNVAAQVRRPAVARQSRR